MRHLVDLTTVETEIAEILKPTKKDKEKAKGYKKNLRELIATFGDLRDSQLQKEVEKRKAERQSEKEVLSDTGSDQGRGFETADEFNQRLNEAAGLTSDEPDATVILPGTTQRRDARVHFDDEQEQEVDTADTGRQQQRETNSQTESSEDTASEDDELEILKQQLAVKKLQ
jgi:DNA gyrase/topoisomerase IV subunit A